MDEGRHVHACFLDVAKAFDHVDHGLLLLKLQRLGLGDLPLQWFRSYLQDWSICTVVNDVRSTMLPISSGVPQGSVLGPLLFVLYFADVPDSVSSTPALYADDTLVYDKNCSAHGLSGCGRDYRCSLPEDLARLLARILAQPSFKIHAVEMGVCREMGCEAPPSVKREIFLGGPGACSPGKF